MLISTRVKLVRGMGAAHYFGESGRKSCSDFGHFGEIVEKGGGSL